MFCVIFLLIITLENWKVYRTHNITWMFNVLVVWTQYDCGTVDWLCHDAVLCRAEFVFQASHDDAMCSVWPWLRHWYVRWRRSAGTFIYLYCWRMILLSIISRQCGTLCYVALHCICLAHCWKLGLSDYIKCQYVVSGVFPFCLIPIRQGLGLGSRLGLGLGIGIRRNGIRQNGAEPLSVWWQLYCVCWQVSVTGVCVGVGVPQGLESANTTISLSSRSSFKHSLYSPSAVILIVWNVSL